MPCTSNKLLTNHLHKLALCAVSPTLLMCLHMWRPCGRLSSNHHPIIMQSSCSHDTKIYLQCARQAPGPPTCSLLSCPNHTRSPTGASVGGSSGSTASWASLLAHNSMPLDLMPRMLRGFRLHNTTTLRSCQDEHMTTSQARGVHYVHSDYLK